MSEAAPLAYDVEPKTVPFSPGRDRLSVVTLTITAKNESAHAVPCSWLTFKFEHGDGGDVLTADPTPIVVAPGPKTPWAIWGSGDGLFRAVPLPPEAGLAANDVICFVFSNIVVNEARGDVEVTIERDAPSAPVAAKVRVKKKDALVELGATPRIVSFTATPTKVGAGGQTTLAWQVEDAEHCVLEPGPIPLANVVSGSLAMTVQEPTTFTLRAFGPGGTDERPRPVTVEPVAVDSFTASPPAGPAKTAVTLAWKTRFAASCSIDQGVGPVPASGSVVVRPQQTTDYTLTALGLEPQAKSVTVEVT
jgi:hypothetical protein